MVKNAGNPHLMTMKRREFLALISATSVTPFLPAATRAAPVAAGYNRYTYGLAVFHARTRASVSAADLVAKLRVSPAAAQSLMAEMAEKAVLKPALNSAAGTMRAITPNGTSRATFSSFGDAARRYVTRDAAAVSERLPQDPHKMQHPQIEKCAAPEFSKTHPCEEHSQTN